MFRLSVLLCVISTVVSFVPRGGRIIATGKSISMKLSDEAVGLVGTDIEYPEFDPWGFTKGADSERIAWYRAAELKHGRVAMLASLGQITQYYFQWDDPVFNQGDKPLKALQQVCEQRPEAAIQIILAIFAAETLGQFNQVRDGAAPGDLGFDPLGLRSDDLELWEKTQLRELKNGRLAMLAIAGMFYTEWVTGNGVLEAWKIGAVSPFNDGIGIF